MWRWIVVDIEEKGMWHYVSGNERMGPVSGEAMRALIASGAVQRLTPVWRDGLSGWIAAELTELGGFFAGAEGRVAAHAVPAARRYAPESFRRLWWWMAGLVGGGLGLVCVGGAAFVMKAAALGVTGFDAVNEENIAEVIKVVAGPLLLMGFGLLVLTAGWTVGYVLLYRLWAVIQDGNARTSPARAVGFSFIPFFNLYWKYVVCVGLAEDMGSFASRYGIEGPRVERSLALAMYVCFLGMIVPYLKAPAFVAYVALAGIVTWRFAGMGAAIAERQWGGGAA